MYALTSPGRIHQMATPYAGKVVVVAGPPCSGKGTQCKRLAAKLGMVHVSTGDVFRDAVARGTELGRAAQGYMERGRFVPDEYASAHPRRTFAS